MTDENKQVEYAPLDSLGRLLAIGGCEVTLRAEGESFAATVALPTGYVTTNHVNVAAPSLGLLMRALELIVKSEHYRGPEPFTPAPSIVVGPDGDLVDGEKRERQLWDFIRRRIGPVLELQEMPKGERGSERAKELARQARFMGEEANGYALPDHLLTRAGMALDQALRCAESGFMPPAGLLTDFIAAQFDQSSDGQTNGRKQLIWGEIDTAQRFEKLPKPWDRKFGRLARNQDRVGRGGGEGQRFLATRCMVVMVPEDVYQAATGWPWFDVSMTLAELAPEGGERAALSLEAERVRMCVDSVAVQVGPAWIDSFYFDALREMGVDEVRVIDKDGGYLVVADGVAAVMSLTPESVEQARANPVPEGRLSPAVGNHYTVTHDCGGGWSQALVRVTYKSDQRLLAVCEGRRRSKDEPWAPDGSEAEWSTAYGEWAEYIEPVAAAASAS